MSILYDENQKAIADVAWRVLEAHYSGERLKGLLETKGHYDKAFWDTARQQGWTGITIPEDHGGLGLSLVEAGIIAEACGAFAIGVPFLITTFGAASAILADGDDRARAWLPKLASGEMIGAIAFGEGQDAVPAAPALKLSNGALTGTMWAVPGGGVADVAVVLAQGEHGPVLALVELEGVARTLIDTFDNSRCTADLVFEGTEANVLVIDDAIDVAHSVLAQQAVLVAHEQVGGAHKMMTTARDYALERRAFGQPIAAFQSIKHRIAEDYALVEIARANAIHAAAHAYTPDFVKWAACARIAATEAYETVTRNTIQVHGGIGVTWEADLHLHQRRARTLAIEGGNMMFWEDLLVEAL